MELPDDVLAIIRNYSKPAFRYWKEYNHVLKTFGIKEHPQLKEKLRTNPQEVLPALLEYEDSFIQRTCMEKLKQEHYDLYKPFSNKDEFYEQNRLHNAVFYARRKEDETKQVLKDLLNKRSLIKLTDS
jgi:hypothetical protein